MSEGRTKNREFERYESDFTVSATAQGGSKKLIEKAVVKDLSGSGLSFISSRPDQYATSQKLTLMIHLPRAGDSSAGMQGKATVVRIDRTSDDHAVICLQLDEPLSFSHTEHGPEKS